MSAPHVREAVAVFQSTEALEAAVDELLVSGFGRADLSVLASEQAIRDKLGHSFRSVRELEDDADVPTTAYVARESIGDAEGAVIGGLLYVGALAGMLPLLASGGSIAAAIVATVVGGTGGAAAGGVLADLIGRHHADALGEHLRHGGLVLWVRTHDEPHEARAVAILERHGGSDVHVHGLPDVRETLERHYGTLEQRGAPPAAGARLAYAGEVLVRMPDGHCYAAGRLFATENEARRYLDGFSREV